MSSIYNSLATNYNAFKNTAGPAIFAAAISVGTGWKAISNITQGLSSRWTAYKDVIASAQISTFQLIPKPTPAFQEHAKKLFSSPNYLRISAETNRMLLKGSFFAAVSAGTAFIAYKLFNQYKSQHKSD